MAWNKVNVDEQRMHFVVRAASGQERMSPLCREFGISRPTGYLWRKRFRQVDALAGLAEHSRRPKRIAHRTEVWKEQRVLALRQQTGWGAKKLRVLLQEEEKISLAVRTIHRILDRHGLISAIASQPAPGRFERSAPNDLWQMDTKGRYLLRAGECHPLSILDDHSRYAVGLYALPELSAEKAYPYLVQTFLNYGLPLAMLMDRGSLWWSARNGWGLTWLSVRLIDLGIQLLYGRVRHPQTQGKVERFHRTLDQAIGHRGAPQEFAPWPAMLEEFRSSYNHRRPHEALAMKRPVERYQPSRRSYVEHAKEWEYPVGSDVRPLNAQGMLTEQRHRWFVCEALAGKRVRVERYAERLLVSYRHMYLREIDPQQAWSRPLVVARHSGAGNAPVALRALSAFPVPTETTKGKV